VAHESATERRGVVRARRWATRALLVLGGVAAGTAAAWAISGASASAAPVVSSKAVAGTDAGFTPVTDATATRLNDFTSGASHVVGDATGASSVTWRDAVCPQDAATWSNPSRESELTHSVSAQCAQGARDQIGGPLRKHGAHRSIDQDVADRVSDSVDGIAQDSLVQPAQRTFGAVEHIARKPQEAGQVIKASLAPSPDARDFGRNVWDFLSNGKGALIQLPVLPIKRGVGPGTPGAGHDDMAQAAPAVQAPATAEAQFASRAEQGADMARTAVKNSPHGNQGDLPTLFAPAGLPLAPLTAPTVPGGGSAPGGHFDGPTFGIPAWSSASLDNAKAGSVLAGVRYMPLTPGSQPGVTPD
jgi:hypothetical protein